MKKIASVFVILLICEVSVCQTACKYKHALKHKRDDPSLSTEEGGLFRNSLFVAPRSFQLEVNSITGSYPNEYSNPVLAEIHQWRYGISSGFEAHSGLSLIDPKEIRSDSLYFGYLQLGLKKRVFHIENRSLKWDLSLVGSYIWQVPSTNDYRVKHGFSFSVNNTWLFFRVVRFDLVLGSVFFPDTNEFRPYLNSHILIKDTNSKVGLLAGFCGNQYLENLGKLGIHYTNNRNYIIQLALAFSDQAASPNLTFTYLFNSRYN